MRKNKYMLLILLLFLTSCSSVTSLFNIVDDRKAVPPEKIEQKTEWKLQHG